MGHVVIGGVWYPVSEVEIVHGGFTIHFNAVGPFGESEGLTPYALFGKDGRLVFRGAASMYLPEGSHGTVSLNTMITGQTSSGYSEYLEKIGM